MKKLLMSIGLSTIIALSTCVLGACKKQEEPPVETVTVYGEFYTVREAYLKGYISIDELKYINDNYWEQEKFTPLEEARREKIIHDYKKTHFVASDDIEVKNYGSYNGGSSTVIEIKDNYYCTDFDAMVCYSYYIDEEVEFNGNKAYKFYSMRVWYESEGTKEVPAPKEQYGAFYLEKRACELGLWPQYNPDDPEYTNVLGFNTKPDIGQETEDKIVHDYLLQDIDFIKDKKDLPIWVDYYGAYGVKLLFKIYDGQHYDPYDQFIPYGYVWIPFDN